MLKEVIIDNIALIDHLSVRFEGGLAALTGETGAGKSIVLDAIGLLLGGRASTELIRSGYDKGQVLGLFELQKSEAAHTIWAEQGLSWPDDDQVVITREIYLQGKSTARINGRPAALTTLRQVSRHLVELHGQHEHQALFDPRLHLSILDQFGGTEHLQTLDDFRASYDAWSTVSEEIDRLEMNEREQIRLADLWRFQLSEITEAELKLGEDEQLLALRSRLSNAERLFAACQSAYQTLYVGAGRQNSILDMLRRVEGELATLTRLDPETAPLQQQFMDCYYQLEDLAQSLGRYQESVVFDPEQLARVEDRLEQVHALKRKYGDSIDEILRYKDTIARSLSELSSREERLAELRQQQIRLHEQMVSVASRLTVSRQHVAGVMQEAVMKELNDLAMPKCRFVVGWIAHSDNEWSGCRNGAEGCEFLISANAGEPLRPLVKVASGGELSRIMLALKTVLARTQGTPTLIFDEIDAGVSGHAAQRIAEKLADLADTSQVLVVTHSAQIAAMGEKQYRIEKQVTDNRTVTSVQLLDESQRVGEIARLLAGGTQSELAAQHAGELLRLAGDYRNRSKQ